MTLWPESPAFGELVYGTCLPGFAGAPEQNCTFDGIWSDQIINPCIVSAITCEPGTYENATFPRSQNGVNASATGCSLGTVGNPVRYCTENGSWSDIIINPCESLSPPPSQIIITNLHDTYFTISWNAVSEALSYDIDISKNSVNFFPVNNGVGFQYSGLSVTVSNLNSYFRYYVEISTINALGTGTPSNMLMVMTYLSPTSEIIINDLEDTSITFSWAVVQYATWYHITLDGNIPTGGNQYSGTENFTISGLTPSTSYLLNIKSGTGSSYEPYGTNFSFTTLTSPTVPSPSPNNTNSNPIILPVSNLPAIIGGAIGGLLFLLLLFIILLFFIRRKRNRSGPMRKRYIDAFEFTAANLLSPFANNSFVAENTLMNSRLAVAMPGFLELEFKEQFEKGEPIGSGGFSKIYRGTLTDPALQKKYSLTDIAIKMVNDEPELTPMENVHKFQQEIAILWSFNNHPNIVALIGYCNVPRCIVTKLYQKDLYKFLHTKSQEVTDNMRLSFALDIATGMAAIHDNGIIHRDLKSSNIMIEATENQGHWKIAAAIGDFGMALVTHSQIEHQVFLNLQGMTPRYTAPEVFSRSRANVTDVPFEIEVKADIYSFAVILYEIITRRKPWEQYSTPSEIESVVLQGHREDLPKDSNQLNELVSQCWSQNSADRPTSSFILQKLRQIISKY